MPELTKDKTLYADGVTKVTAGPELVFFRQSNMFVTISHDAMREIVIGWTRHEDREMSRG